MDLLLVEDNSADVELARIAVEGKDVRLSVVGDGEQALAFLRQEGPHANAPFPDLVVLDLKIPRKDGLEVLAEVNADPKLRRAPVVVFTSSEAPRDLERAYALGARACFAKPDHGLDGLLDTVISFFRRARDRPEELGDVLSSMPRLVAEPSTPLPDPTTVRMRHMAATADAAADAIIGVDLDGLITCWNAGAEHLYGYVADEAIGRRLSLIVPQERVSEMESLLSRVREGTPPLKMETMRVDREGREVHVEVTVSAIRDRNGAVVGKAAISRDITAQNQAEERFRLAVEASPSAMLMVDARGRMLLVNAEAERLFGYAREELIGQSVEILVPERFRDVHPRHRASFLIAPEIRAMGAGRELFGVRKDGVEVPVEIGLNPIHTADGTFVLSSIVDVTERRLAEERFRLAVEASPSGMLIIAEDGHIMLVNQEAERMFGYARGELIGKRVDALVPMRFRGQHRRHREGFGANPQSRAMGTGRDLYGVHRDGTEFPVEVGLNPIQSLEGLLVLSTVVDITSRKKAEREVEDKARELARSNEELEQFAYVASHDLQEPLRMVASYTRLLEERYASAFDEDGRRFIGYAQDGAARMKQMIGDLLSYSRVRTRGKDLQPVDAAECFARARANLRLAIEEADATIEGEVRGEVMADDTQLESVFQNLLSNALKFRGSAAPVIHVSSQCEGRRIVFAVSDNGIGIAPGFANRIFVMFERLQGRERYPGTGIGLALCRRIIERHGGTIRVDSDGKSGSTFTFNLAAAD